MPEGKSADHRRQPGVALEAVQLRWQESKEASIRLSVGLEILHAQHEEKVSRKDTGLLTLVLAREEGSPLTSFRSGMDQEKSRKKR